MSKKRVQIQQAIKYHIFFKCWGLCSQFAKVLWLVLLGYRWASLFIVLTKMGVYIGNSGVNLYVDGGLSDGVMQPGTFFFKFYVRCRIMLQLGGMFTIMIAIICFCQNREKLKKKKPGWSVLLFFLLFKICLFTTYFLVILILFIFVYILL